MQVGAGVIGAGRAAAGGIDRRRVVGVAGVAQIEGAAGDVGAPGAARARRQHAVEQVDPPAHGLDDVRRRAHAHQIARAPRRQRALQAVEHGQHPFLAFADREPADGVAVEADLHQGRRRFRPQRRKDPALHDAEQPVARARREGRPRKPGPAHRAAHGGRRLRLARRVGRALVQHHGDVAAQPPLQRHHARRRQAVAGAVRVGAERHPVLVHGAQPGQRHHLEAAGIREDRAGPVHEPVQAAQPGDSFGAGADHQVVGVAEQHVGAARPHDLRQQALDRRLGAHRHEGRSPHRAVGRLQPPESRRAVRRLDGEGEAHAAPRASRQASP